MKRCLSLIAVILILLCSCSKNEPEVNKTADMLTITNTEKTFAGCRERMADVLRAVKAKVDVLEAEHNRAIKIENPDEYFLDTDYIHTAFDPFLLASEEIANSFTAEMTDEAAISFYSNFSNGAQTIYESDGESYFTVKFVSENMTREYSAEYDKKNDSFIYTVTVETEEGVTVEEFLEFTKGKKGEYVIQSLSERFFVEFDKEDNIVTFCCGKLRNDSFSVDESVYPSPEKTIDEHWVLSKGKSQFLSIHSFEDGVLTHEDCSSGPWKSISIIARDYESAFYNF